MHGSERGTTFGMEAGTVPLFLEWGREVVRNHLENGHQFVRCARPIDNKAVETGQRNHMGGLVRFTEGEKAAVDVGCIWYDDADMLGASDARWRFAGTAIGQADPRERRRAGRRRVGRRASGPVNLAPVCAVCAGYVCAVG